MGDLVVDGRACGDAATMSSREIARLVDARHNDVVATIERLHGKGLLRSSRKTRKERTGGRPVDVYDLTERDTHLIVAGYSDEHRAKVIDRWIELEAKQAALDEAKVARQRARLEAPALADAVKHSRQAAGKDTKHYHYSNEFDLINRVVVGSSSKQLRDIRGCRDSEPLRDLFTPSEINAVEHMQRLNASLIDVGMPYQERKAKLEQVFKARYQQALIDETMRLCA